MDKPVSESAKHGGDALAGAAVPVVDYEALARNIARLIEEGGKALAAYMKPREQGKIKEDLAEDVTDIVKTMGRVTEYWMADPKRALDNQTTLGPAYPDLWAACVRGLGGGGRPPA